jgi:uncharacterized cupin superfamily protein
MTFSRGPVINIDEAEEESGGDDPVWGGDYRVLTPFMDEKGGKLGMNVTRLGPGKIGCPFHSHYVDDEIFFILSGSGVIRYGEEIYPVRPGDAISCPAGTGVAHQIANTGEEDLLYLGIGANSAIEVTSYPDSGKVMVRRLGVVGYLTKAAFMEGEPEQPALFGLLGDRPAPG